MKRYFYIALICGMIATFIGCGAPSWQSRCRGNTLLAIDTVGMEYPVRGILGNASEEGAEKRIFHLQAEYFRDGEWRPLEVMQWSEVWEGSHEFKLINVRYLSAEEVFDRCRIRLKKKGG